LEAVSEQLEAGLDEITDGLISWADPISHFASRCSGFRIGGLRRFFDTSFHYRIPVITGKAPKRKEPFVFDEVKYARGLCNRPVRAILTGPLTLAIHSQSDIKNFSKVSSRLALFADLLLEEIKALAKDGNPVIQIDEPSLLHHPEELPAVRKIYERFLKAAQPSKLILAASFLPKEAPIEILFDLPVGSVQLDVTPDLKGFLARIDRFRPLATLGLGVINARTTRVDLPDPLLNVLEPWLEKNLPETLYLTTSTGLEMVPRETAQNKLRALGRLKLDLAKRLSLPVIHG
jgi:5-methyltetrahydropteroyltriglutamate--homocysteine methyltransferase